MNSIKLNGNNDLDPLRTTQRADAGREAEANTATSADAANIPRAADAIHLSDRAAAIGRLVEQAGRLPEVRAEQVERLRSLVQSGAYRPDAAAIADALLGSEG